MAKKISKKLQTIAENVNKVYSSGYTGGYAVGYNEGYDSGMVDAPANEEIKLYKSIVENTISGEVVIPENFKVGSSGMYSRTKITKLTVPASCSVDTYSFQKCTGLIEVEWYKNYTIGTALYQCSNLTTVIFHNRVGFRGNDVFGACSSLENVIFNSTCFLINDISCNFTSTTVLTVQSMLNLFNALEDNTGGTTFTIKLGATNLAKLTEEQKAIAVNKNYALA